METKNVDPVEALKRAKWSFNARRVDRDDARGVINCDEPPTVGSLALCQIQHSGQHTKLQLAEGRYSEHYPGDFFIAPCGNRYAPDQFEGVAEVVLDNVDLLAAGGIVGKMRWANAEMAKPTQARLVGYVADQAGRVINIADYALSPKPTRRRIPVFVVVGASMNAGKTTITASLAHGLSRAGLQVAAMKATGSGAFGDYNAFRDAGVDIVADFTDLGLPSTYLQPITRLERVFADLVSHAVSEGADIAVVEFADGVFQPETRALLQSSRVRAAISGVLYAAPDAASSIAGVRELRALELDPLAVSGKVTLSPLGVREAEAATGARFVSRDELRQSRSAIEFVGFSAASVASAA